MSNTTRDIAERAASLCTGLVALALPAAAGIAPLVVPLLGLAAMGVELRKSNARRAGDRAAAAVLAALSCAREYRSEEIAAAREILMEQRGEIYVAPKELAAQAGELDCDETMARRLADAMHLERRTPVHDLIVVALTASLAELRRDEDFARDLTQQLLFEGIRSHRLQLELLGGLDLKVTETLAIVRRLETEPQNVVEETSRDVLDHVASRFGHDNPAALKLPQLQEFLTQKAGELSVARAEVEALRGLTPHIDGVLGDVDAALERLDLAEAEALLAAVRVTSVQMIRKPLEDNARVMEAQARVALLRERTENAFSILSAAADSFAGLDRSEPSRRRLDYSKALDTHGRRYGGAALSLEASMIRRALDDMPAWEKPEQRARAQNNLGNALSTQGERLGGEAGVALLTEAVACYRAALSVCSPKSFPRLWAAAQHNLGGATLILGKWCSGAEGQQLIGGSAECFRSSQWVWTEAEHPIDWALAENNRGGALHTLAERLGPTEGMFKLRRSARAFRAAMRVWTEANDPPNWAMSQMNLGNALSLQGEWTDGDYGTDLLGEAVDAFSAALRVRTIKEHPLEWAYTTNNLGNALKEQGQRLGGRAGVGLILQAIKGRRVALPVLAKAGDAVEWAMATENLGLAYEALANNQTWQDPQTACGKAEKCFCAALRVFDPEHMPYNHNKTSNALARVRARLGRRNA